MGQGSWWAWKAWLLDVLRMYFDSVHGLVGSRLLALMLVFAVRLCDFRMQFCLRPYANPRSAQVEPASCYDLSLSLCTSTGQTHGPSQVGLGIGGVLLLH